ncbi:MFS transporter [Streptomyces boluensis]|uniref:Putative proline/betaine transporter n=1 Tax=Streptomyces boluensis TaxID=1775135 RepID=A0A964UMA5_9ACTN|nr:MFS transporter [Streptomyces boluensis]NBE51843.1 MFS transporter [Streptomyces boluensis]
MSAAPSPHDSARPKTTTAATTPDPALLRRVALSSLLGTIIEYYDFLLYGTMAALAFGPLFFPETNPTVGTIAAFGTLAAGYVARPVGGAVFGHFGDRLGRKTMLVLTMILMGAASFLIGVLPTYETIGLAAPILLVLLRVVQGIAIGGEWGGATLMVVEHADARRRGLWNGLMQMGSPIGFLLSTVAVTAISRLPRDQFMSWGWRVPFLFSALLLVIGLYVRLSISESPLFRQAVEAQRERKATGPARLPLAQVLRRPRALLLACAVGIGPFALTGLISIYMLTYATGIGYATADVMNGLIAASFAGLVTIPAFSALSDRVGRRAVVAGGAVGIVLCAFPMYALIDTKSPTALILGMLIGQSLQSAMYAPLGPLLSEMFGTEVRYTGASMGYQLAALIGSGFTPLVASGLLSGPGGLRSAPLSVLAICCALVSTLAVWRIAETRGKDLSAPEGA